MKTKLFFIAFISMFSISNGQIDSVKYDNEIGTDFTPLFTNIFIGNVSPTFNLYYKRYFKNNSIRFSTTYNNYKQSSNISNYTLINKQNAIDITIGYQYNSKLTNKWYIFYGFDFNYGNNSIYNESLISQYIRKNENITSYYGVGATLGIKYFINKRFSIASETSYFFVNKIENVSTTNTIIDLSSNQNIPDNTTEEYKSSFTKFLPPITLILTFNF